MVHTDRNMLQKQNNVSWIRLDGDVARDVEVLGQLKCVVEGGE
jgi:hypothetical protein